MTRQQEYVERYDRVRATLCPDSLINLDQHAHHIVGAVMQLNGPVLWTEPQPETDWEFTQEAA